MFQTLTDAKTSIETTDHHAYHKHIIETYDKRSGNHDGSEWH